MKLYLRHSCPCCGSKIYVTNKGYHCSKCDFFIKGYICNRHISLEEAEAVLNNENPILDGFSTDDGKMFSSIPVVKGCSVVLDNTVFVCHTPHGDGRIVVGKRFFKCENKFNCVLPCIFNISSLHHIRRSIDGHMFTANDIHTLFINGQVCIQSFTTNGDIKKRLISFLYNSSSR